MPPVPAIFASGDGLQTEKHAVKWHRNRNHCPHQSAFLLPETVKTHTNRRQPMERSSSGIEMFQKINSQKIAFFVTIAGKYRT